MLAGLLILFNACSTNQPVNFDQLQDRSGLFYLANEKAPFTGDVVSFKNGKPVLEGHVSNGLRDGLWIYYYPSGQKQAEGKYADGLKEGVWNYWKENGEEDAMEVYKMGNKLGNETAADSVPSAAPEEPAKPATTAKTGSKAQEPSAKDEEVKEEKVSEPEPVLQKEPEKPKPLVWERLRGGPVKTLDGIPYTGDVVKYFSSGGLELKGHFTDGRRTGKWTFYYPNGSVKDVKYY
jgi:antitoxin component YwqK of YwqJK toxin-antitoxin module